MISPHKTRENIEFYSPTWTGISSPKCPVAAPLHCPCCNHSFKPENDPQLEALYSSDEFRMYHFKVQRCPLSRTCRDWTDCPYVHPGEKARRRDPRKFLYSSELCADFSKNKKCPKRDECQFAHGVFEVWLHPERYRTELCRDGIMCQRKVCFFAHSVEQLRWPGDGHSDLTSETEILSVPISPSDHTNHLPILSSLLNAIMIDMQRTSSNTIKKNGSFCSADMFRGVVIEPDVKWVSDLVDF